MRVLLLLLATSCASSEAQRPVGPAPVVVRTVAVTEASLPRPVHGAGRLQSADEVTLSFPAGGVVARVEVEAGERAERGQVLAILDAAPARSQLESAQSAVTKAERDLARTSALEGTALARAQREDAATGLEIARANLSAAEYAVRRSVLIAPADGVVVDRYVDPNQTVAPGAPVIRLATDSAWELPIVVPAADALRIEPGLDATVRLAAYGDAPFSGRVVRRAGGAGGLGNWTVTVALDPADRPLASGLVGSADLAPLAEALPVVPLSAIAEVDGSRAAIYAVEGGVARRLPVRIAFFADDQVALVPPVEVAAVVESGTPFLRDGAPVRVAEVQ
jgi:RND family efflux transporter MFP subunit